MRSAGALRDPEKDDMPDSNDHIERLEFYVEGVAIPQGSKTGFSRIDSKRVSMTDANAKVLKPWREKVRAAAVVALSGRPGFASQVECALIVDFYLPRPKAAKRRRPSVKPDLDKLVRAINDSLTDSGVLTDDSQVVTVSADKWYADDKPGVRIVVRELA